MPYSYRDLPDKFTRDYVETALACTTDNSDESGGETLDRNYSIEDIEDETVKDMIVDCREFQAKYADDLELVDEYLNSGSDFWHTRHYDGAGFWSAEYGKPPDVQAALKRLTDAAHAYGDYDLFVTDNGTIAAGHTRASVARYLTTEPHARCNDAVCVEHVFDPNVSSCKITPLSGERGRYRQ